MSTARDLPDIDNFHSILNLNIKLIRTTRKWMSNRCIVPHQDIFLTYRNSPDNLEEMINT